MTIKTPTLSTEWDLVRNLFLSELTSGMNFVSSPLRCEAKQLRILSFRIAAQAQLHVITIDTVTVNSQSIVAEPLVVWGVP